MCFSCNNVTVQGICGCIFVVVMATVILSIFFFSVKFVNGVARVLEKNNKIYENAKGDLLQPFFILAQITCSELQAEYPPSLPSPSLFFPLFPRCLFTAAMTDCKLIYYRSQTPSASFKRTPPSLSVGMSEKSTCRNSTQDPPLY